MLCPSRELARQIQKVVDDIGQFTNIKTFLAVPQSWSRNQAINKQILIGTPGTIIDMLGRGKRIFDPMQIKILVLDEADEMVNQQGMGDQSFRIKRYVSLYPFSGLARLRTDVPDRSVQECRTSSSPPPSPRMSAASRQSSRPRRMRYTSRRRK